MTPNDYPEFNLTSEQSWTDLYWRLAHKGNKEGRVSLVARQIHDNNLLQGGGSWDTAGHQWLRYMRAEAYELMDHYGTFKHWKAASTDLQQAQMEMVDILIFALSHAIAEGRLEMHCHLMAKAFDADHVRDFAGDRDINEAIEDLVELSFRDAIYWAQFATICYKLHLDFDKLVMLFEGKNALNYVRATNGYKEGTYLKKWFGQEDNEILRESVLNNNTVM